MAGQKIGDKRSTQHPVKMNMNMIKNTFLDKNREADDDPLSPVCRCNTSSCVRSARPRVFQRGRVAGIHGDVVNVHTTTC